MEIGKKVYLGDGVYAEHDGYHLILKANSPDDPTDTIYLDSSVIIALLDLLKTVFDADKRINQDV